MAMSWLMQAAVISLVAGLGLGVAIRFTMMSRVQDRTRRLDPQLGNIGPTPAMVDVDSRRTPTA